MSMLISVQNIKKHVMIESHVSYNMSYIKVKHNIEKHVIISYMQMG